MRVVCRHIASARAGRGWIVSAVLAAAVASCNPGASPGSPDVDTDVAVDVADAWDDGSNVASDTVEADVAIMDAVAVDTARDASNLDSDAAAEAGDAHRDPVETTDAARPQEDTHLDATPSDVADSDAPTPFESACVDGIDNDEDGLFDCGDPDCTSNAACALPEVWVLYVHRNRLGYTSRLHAFSSRLPDETVVLDVPGSPEHAYAGFGLSESATSLFAMRSSPSITELLIANATEVIATPAEGYVHYEFALTPDETTLVTETARWDSYSSRAIEFTPWKDTDPVARVVADPEGRLLMDPAIHPDGRVWASRMVEPPDPLVPDSGVWELVIVDPDATPSIIQVGTGNLFEPVIRRSTGRIYAISPTGVSWSSAGFGEPWARDGSAGGRFAVPVGDDMWARPVGSTVQVWSESLGVVATHHVPDYESDWRATFISAELAPANGELEDLRIDR